MYLFLWAEPAEPSSFTYLPCHDRFFFNEDWSQKMDALASKQKSFGVPADKVTLENPRPTRESISQRVFQQTTILEKHVGNSQS